MKSIDISKLIPKETPDKDPIKAIVKENKIIVDYYRLRAKKEPVTINRFIPEGVFIVGVAIWACEGTRRKKEVEFSNGSAELVTLFMDFLTHLGVENKALARVHAPIEEVPRCEKYWASLTGIKNFKAPITKIRKLNPESNGIVHIRIYRKILWSLLSEWAKMLPQLVQ